MPRGYSPEFRRKVLDLVKAGRPVREVARDLGISEQTIYVWRRQDLIDSGQEGWYAFVAVRAAGTDNWLIPAQFDSPTDSTGNGYGADSRNRPSELRSFRLLLCTTNLDITRCGWGSNYRQTDYGDPLNTTHTGIVSGY